MLRILMKAPEITPTKLNPIVHEYGYKLDDKRRKVFGVLNTFDCRERIQAFANLCDYAVIMKALNPSPAEFSDFGPVIEIASDIHDVNDVLAYSDVLRDEFVSLPLEVKKHYGNDFELFARDVIGGGFADFIAETYNGDCADKADKAAHTGDITVIPDVSVGNPTAAGNSAGQPAAPVPGTDTDLKRQVDELRKRIEEGAAR